MENYKRTAKYKVTAYAMQGFSINSYNDMIKQSIARSMVDSVAAKLDVEIVEVSNHYGCEVCYESVVYILTPKEMKEFKTQIIKEWLAENTSFCD